MEGKFKLGNNFTIAVQFPLYLQRISFMSSVLLLNEIETRQFERHYLGSIRIMSIIRNIFLFPQNLLSNKAIRRTCSTINLQGMLGVPIDSPQTKA